MGLSGYCTHTHTNTIGNKYWAKGGELISHNLVGELSKSTFSIIIMILLVVSLPLRKDCGHSDKSHAASSASGNPRAFLGLVALPQELCAGPRRPGDCRSVPRIHAQINRNHRFIGCMEHREH